ncbi:MAG: sulfotransferase [Dehalococcoidia bacterium]
MAQGKAQPITDLARPQTPLAFRTANLLGRPLAPVLFRLDEESLLKSAGKQTGLDDFGGSSFLKPMRILLKSLREEASLSAFGQLATRRLMVQLLSTRLILQDMLNRHPEIVEERIEKPIVIAGLPRTGTTHLHNLMSRDPGLRYIPYWQSLEPFPPASPDSKKPEPDLRRKNCEQALKFLDYVMPLFVSMHEMSVDGPHEEMQLLAVHFSTMLFESIYYLPAYRDWYRASDHEGAYSYMKLILQAMQWQDGDRRRWVLKSPQHLEQFGPLMKTFPDAYLVQTHRDPVRITASVCTMMAYAQRMNAAKVDPLAVGEYWSARTEDLLRASVEQRHLIPRNQIIDIRFDEYMADQVGNLKRAYDFVEQPFTAEARQAIEAFIADNPKGKHGTVQYRLENVGIDPAERRAALKFYQDFFNVPEERN